MVVLHAELDIRVQRSVRSGQGLDRLVVTFPKSAGALPYRFATRVRRYARAKAPVDTGYLRSTIQRERLGERAHRVYVGAHYGIYVNYGTRYQAAQPFWEPAIAQARRDLHRDMKEMFRG